jgi:dsRNA-specific ribonuclease
LATIQIFLEKTVAEEGEMHIARANLICNANLHRAAIKKKLFLYAFTTKKKGEPAPIIKEFKDLKHKKEEQLKFANTEINVLGENDDDDGYQYIPGKVHADMMEALIGIFYLKNKKLNDCQTMLYAFGILKKSTLLIDFNYNDVT